MEIGEKYKHKIDESEVQIIGTKIAKPLWNSKDEENCVIFKVIKKDKWNDMKIGEIFVFSISKLESQRSNYTKI